MRASVRPAVSDMHDMQVEIARSTVTPFPSFPHEGLITACPVCRGGALQNHTNNLSFCGDCDHTFQSDLKVSAVYNSDYAHQYDNRPHQEMSRIRWDFIQKNLNLAPGSKVLDVGYGNGSFLKYAQAHGGADIYGIDLHGEDFGVPEVQFGTAIEFDLVCFFDSLEHFDNFDLPHSLQTKNVIVSIPNAPDFLLKAPQDWRHYKPGEHLHYFSHESLDLCLFHAGLKHKIVEGYPEDALRGKLNIHGQSYDNIYTAIYSREAPPSSR
jgi:hypothetical protein